MKMKLYYVVKDDDGRYGEGHVYYVAGPFTYDAAWNYLGEKGYPDECYVLDQEIEVS